MLPVADAVSLKSALSGGSDEIDACGDATCALLFASNTKYRDDVNACFFPSQTRVCGTRATPARRRRNSATRRQHDFALQQVPICAVPAADIAPNPDARYSVGPRRAPSLTRRASCCSTTRAARIAVALAHHASGIRLRRRTNCKSRFGTPTLRPLGNGAVSCVTW